MYVVRKLLFTGPAFSPNQDGDIIGFGHQVSLALHGLQHRREQVPSCSFALLVLTQNGSNRRL